MENLPKELKNFLQSEQQLEYDHSNCEPGKITLKKFKDLNVGEVWIDSEESPIAEKDPNKEKEGYYSVPAVSLTEDCEGYDPDFILLWLPNENLFGTWDCDHWDLKIFPEATWNDIVKSPLPYINAQWEGDSKIVEYFVPYPEYEFKLGRPF
jgi:hypothetical protein